jgi:mono/diheme cytochrome c family protein
MIVDRDGSCSSVGFGVTLNPSTPSPGAEVPFCFKELPMIRDFLLASSWIALGGLLIVSAERSIADDRGVLARADASVRTREQIEQDWLRQLVVRPLPPEPLGNRSASAVSTSDDASGAVDGIVDGSYGFHTSLDPSPWWQVDLLQVVPIDRIVVYNRCDGDVHDRASRIQALISEDGQHWHSVYRHDGTPFFGQVDDKPLVIDAADATARFVRLQLPGPQYLHLDQVQVYRSGTSENIALRKPADQSSASPWSRGSLSIAPEPIEDPASVIPEVADVIRVIERGRMLAADLQQRGVDVDQELRRLQQIRDELEAGEDEPAEDARRDALLQAQWSVRRLALANPLLDFEDLLFVKRVPGSFTHMSDQYYGWFSRPGGGLYILEDFKSDSPRLRHLTEGMPPGSFLRPDLSYDGRRVLFAYCRHVAGLDREPNKLDKSNVPEDAFYHLYEMNVDGSGLRRLTHGKYDDFDGRYLPDGRIVFLSTRRGQHLQTDLSSAHVSQEGDLPDGYVRCGGGPERPVAVYTLHVIDRDGTNLRQISPFEMFEWTPSVDSDGRILYSRWDYVDRDNMPYMSLWSTLPDGTAPQAVYGNYTVDPHCFFEARRVPGSRKIVFTASAHHAQTGGSLVLLDPRRASDGDAGMTRLTPEVAFPETEEGWPATYFAGPLPLCENHYLVSWSATPLPPGTPRPFWGMPGPANDLGIYLLDAFGNLNLIYRDATIGSETPLPVRPRTVEPQIPLLSGQCDSRFGQLLIQDVYQGLPEELRGTIHRLRVVGIPIKTHPTMNYPPLGLTRDDPGKFVLGSVPVEEDGSANLLVPAGVPFFLQTLNAAGQAVQTMRSATYVQAGQTFACVGCHEPRNSAPHVQPPLLALSRAPSRLAPEPPGTWPLDFEELVGPVLQQHCLGCHHADGEADRFDLTGDRAYLTLANYGHPSLREHVMTRYRQGRSIANAGASQESPLIELLRGGHHDVQLESTDWQRLFVWMDTYGQHAGSFGHEQAEDLRRLRQHLADLLEE